MVGESEDSDYGDDRDEGDHGDGGGGDGGDHGDGADGDDDLAVADIIRKFPFIRNIIWRVVLMLLCG